MRIPLAVDLKINAYSGSEITDYDSGISNGMVKKKAGRLFVTQRPSINMFEDASTTSAAARGRGIYYWEAAAHLYIVNDDSVYKDTQDSTAIGSITAGTKKCSLLELGSYLVLLDPENDEGWTINTSSTLAAISDADFPSTLAYGGAVLNNVLYVLDEDGNVQGSADGDPTSWDALNTLDAQRDPDGGVYLGKHHDNLVVMGPRSIEFFYDAGNATGSPLSRRQDIEYRIGCNNGETVWEVGDRIFFVGVNESGSLTVYKIEAYSITPVSNDDIDSFLTAAIVHSGYGCVGSGFATNGHYFYLLTLYTTPSDISPERTIVYDATAGLWYPSWSTSIGSHTTLPLISWSVRASLAARIGEGILANGDLISPKDDLIPNDSSDGQTYVTDGYVASLYITSVSADGTAIPVIIRTGQSDMGLSARKRGDRLSVVADRASASQTVTVKWANENNDTFTDGRTVNLAKRRILRGLGLFERRNHQVEFTASEKLEVEALDVQATPCAV